MNSVITIGRQFGSGGHEIGEMIAKHYNIPYYDKELLSIAAKKSGFCEEMIQNHDEHPTSSFLYNLVMDTYSVGYSSFGNFVDIPIGQKIFLAQFDAIKAVAAEGPCVIVGRCADYALSNVPNCINIFIYGDADYRIKRIMNKHDLSAERAKDLMLKKDKQRQSYYNYYSNKKWGIASTYHISVDSEILGLEGTADMLEHFIERSYSKK